MRSYVADTSVASLILRKRPEVSAYRERLEGSRIYLSFQTIAEMRFGALLKNWGGKRRRELEDFLGSYTTLEYTDELADKWAIIMKEARLAGRRLESGDAWIAATALLLDIPLLTHDRDFDQSACPSIIVYSYRT